MREVSGLCKFGGDEEETGSCEVCGGIEERTGATICIGLRSDEGEEGIGFKAGVL